MVKLKGPGLSAAASGSIGDAITFSSAKGRAYVKNKPTPAQPRSSGQVSMRAMMTFLVQQWKNLTSNQQVTWADAYPDPELNNYNAYIRHNLKRWRSVRAPSKAYPAAEAARHPNAINLTATGAGRHVTLDMQASTPPFDNWLLLLFHSKTATPGGEFDKLIHCELAEDTDHHYWTHSPLTPGTHYYRIVSATDDGNPTGFATATDSAIVT